MKNKTNQILLEDLNFKSKEDLNIVVKEYFSQKIFPDFYQDLTNLLKKTNKKDYYLIYFLMIKNSPQKYINIILNDFNGLEQKKEKNDLFLILSNESLDQGFVDEYLNKVSYPDSFLYDLLFHALIINNPNYNNKFIDFLLDKKLEEKNIKLFLNTINKFLDKYLQVYMFTAKKNICPLTKIINYTNNIEILNFIKEKMNSFYQDCSAYYIDGSYKEKQKILIDTINIKLEKQLIEKSVKSFDLNDNKKNKNKL